jgi:SLOG cluster4 family
MQRSRLIIGVMGGDGPKDAAQRLGAAITSRGHIVLTGGKNQDKSEVKDAALFGAARSAASSGGVARLVGILRGGIPAWEPHIAANEQSFFLHTGLTSAERDCITGTTPDALIILCGSTGTLTETAFAEIAGRPVLFLASKSHLLRKRREHGEESGDGKLAAFFKDAGAVYERLMGRSFTVSDLWSALDRSLANGPEFPEGSEIDVVEEAIRCSAKIAPYQTSFPGLPDEPELTRRKFNEVVRRIEQ